jgi:hypothetical protein
MEAAHRDAIARNVKAGGEPTPNLGDCDGRPGAAHHRDRSEFQGELLSGNLLISMNDTELNLRPPRRIPPQGEGEEMAAGYLAQAASRTEESRSLPRFSRTGPSAYRPPTKGVAAASKAWPSSASVPDGVESPQG